MRRRQAADLHGSAEDVAFFERAGSHIPRTFARVMRRLPADPRCRLCRAPYGSVGGWIMRRFGYGPSRKNPSICNTCFEKAPLGGVEMEIGVLFADVRDFTPLAAELPAGRAAELLNRFYGSATEILTRTAIVDKLVGDEVMALYLPVLIDAGWEDAMLRDARDLLRAVGYGNDGDPWLRIGVGIDVGRAYVGNVGTGEVKDFTAIGDVVNTAARLQSAAGAGQVVLSERVFARLAHRPPSAHPEQLALKGKPDLEPARILDLAAG